jgi:hypothetical protein
MEYVVVRHSSFGLHNLVRKGGSDEGEEKPKSRAVVIEYGGLYFFDGVRSETLLSHNYPQGYYKGSNSWEYHGLFL